MPWGLADHHHTVAGPAAGEWARAGDIAVLLAQAARANALLQGRNGRRAVNNVCTPGYVWLRGVDLIGILSHSELPGWV
jgi:hypothetical protein